MKNTTFTIESETHIATFEVVGYDSDDFDAAKRSTYTMPWSAEADFDSGRERARELTSAFGFGINAQPILRRRDGSGACIAWTTIIGNHTAVLMSLAKKESA